MAFRHGKNGNCTIGSSPVTLKITGWSVDDQSELADSSNTQGGGFKEYTAGLEGADFTIDAQWRSDQSPFDTAAPALTPGTELTAVKLYVGTPTSTPYYSFPTAIVEKATVKSVVNGVITWSVSCKNQGAYSRPVT